VASQHDQRRGAGGECLDVTSHKFSLLCSVTP
jgi:hypothetical protein